MLQVSFIRENKDLVIAGLTKKFLPDAEAVVEKVLSTDEERREVQLEKDELSAKANEAARSVGMLMKEGKKEAAEVAKKESASFKQGIKDLSAKFSELEDSLTQQLYQIPNLPHEKVPAGKTEDDNEILFERGEKPTLAEGSLPHWDLIKKYQLVDFELGNKVAGAGFPFYKGKGAKLQRALVNFFLDKASDAGFTEVQPPVVINEASGYGTGQFPDKEGQMYKIEGHDLYLIPTAEVPITNMLRDVILEEKDLPVKLAGFTPCFRREAGSWGANVRGLNRLHQFDKVEIVQVAHPDKSYELHEQMTQHVESILDDLGLPFRRLLLCGGDISFNATLCYDLEVFSAGQEKWLEVSSISNFENYQSNRLKLRFRAGKKKVLAHTLNGSALALPRIMAALIENNQTPEGIVIPEVLRPYTKFDIIN